MLNKRLRAQVPSDHEAGFMEMVNIVKQNKLSPQLVSLIQTGLNSGDKSHLIDVKIVVLQTI